MYVGGGKSGVARVGAGGGVAGGVPGASAAEACVGAIDPQVPGPALYPLAPTADPGNCVSRFHVIVYPRMALFFKTFGRIWRGVRPGGVAGGIAYLSRCGG